jgi:hypothetical protein
VKKAAVAYVTSEAHVVFGAGDVLVCDASPLAIASGQTDARVLRRAFQRGAELHSFAGLHAKVMVFGEIAVIGSANLSASALVEAALITTDHVVLAGVASLIEDIVESAEIIDDRFLDRIGKIVVKRSRGPRAGRRKPTFADRGRRTWLVRVNELADDAFPQEARAVEKGLADAQRKHRNHRSDVGWIRVAGNSSFRQKARAGDTVIQIWKDLGSKRVRVLKNTAICHPQRTRKWARFYLEEIVGTQALSMSWTDFERLARSSGLKTLSKVSVKSIDADVAEEIVRRWRGAKRSRPK